MDPDKIVTEIGQEKLQLTEIRFAPMSVEELVEILGLTIKMDDHNKVVAFLAQLTAYTEDSQLNISFNAPSSTGKSYIPTEVAKLFPPEDVVEIGYTSPTAFFHDAGEFNKEKGGYIVDLSRRILIFLDQPHDMLLQYLRPMLSHDKKEICIKITDKSQKHGLKTKNIFLIGFPVVIFCTAGLKSDEQETTRFILLSPEIGQEKIREAVLSRIRKESDDSLYGNLLITDSKRSLLRQRIVAIKEAGIRQINIKQTELVEMLFMSSVGILKPRHQRDIGKVISLIKSLALLNLWFRKHEDGILYADEDDITQAFDIWRTLSESQELNLPPYVYNLYREIIVVVYKEKNGDLDSVIKIGLSRQDIMKKHHEVYGRFLPDWQLRQQIIPMLETAGLLVEERDDPTDKRKILYYPTTLLTISPKPNNSEWGGGVEQEKLGI